MKISLWISAIVLCAVRTAFSSSIQVGTVLFSKTDFAKRCWSESDKALLRARFIMQDVLPDPECIDFSKPGAVMILLEYFQFCYEIINRSSYGKVQNLMFLALSDTLGGYLRAYVLPHTKRAYYAGQVKYSDAKKLFQLYDDIRAYLKTNGIGWAQPAKLYAANFMIKPLSINTEGREDACAQLYLIENKPTRSIIDPSPVLENFHNSFVKGPKRFREGNEKKFKRNVRVENPKEFEGLDTSNIVRKNVTRDSRFTRKIAVLEKAKNLKAKYFRKMRKKNNTQNSDKLAGNVTSARLQKEDRKYRSECEKRNDRVSESSPKIYIPLPVLDDSSTPHTIAVPFKRRPLRSLETPKSAFLLERYYATVVKCLVSKRDANSDVKSFNSDFHSWLVSKVLPHLSDEAWYPAFGGVLRILETIKKLGVRPPADDFKSDDIAFIFSNYIDDDGNQNDATKGKERVRDVGDFDYDPGSFRRNYIFAILLIGTTCILSFCACAFYLQAKKSGKDYAPCPKKLQKENFVNLQFLVRFFKRNERSQEYVEPVEKESSDSDSLLSSIDSVLEQSLSRIEFGERSMPKMDYKVEKAATTRSGQLILTGNKEVPAFIISNVETPKPCFESSMRLVQAKQAPCIRFEKIGPSNAEMSPQDKGKSKNVSTAKNFYEKVETIWKKPSAKFQKTAKRDKKGDSKNNKDSEEKKKPIEKKKKEFYKVTGSTPCSLSMEEEKKDYSTDKRSTSYSYSGTCSQSNETTTFSSSNVQGNEKSNQDSMKFLRKVIAKHKPLVKSSVQDTTEESNSEGDTSCSCETDY